MSFEKIQLLFIGETGQLQEILPPETQKKYRIQVWSFQTINEAKQELAKTNTSIDVILTDIRSVKNPRTADYISRLRKQHQGEIVILDEDGSHLGSRNLKPGTYHCVHADITAKKVLGFVRFAAQQSLLNSLTQSVFARPRLDNILDNIAQVAKLLTTADEVAIVLPDANKYHFYPKIKGEIKWRKHFKKERLTRDMIKSGYSIRVTDTEKDERIHPNVKESGIRSFRGVPIPGINGNVGVLYIYSRQPGHFVDLGATATSQALAVQAGYAITNARAFERLETLLRASSTLNSSLKFEKVMQETCKTAVKLFGVDHSGMVQLLPDGRGKIIAEFPEKIGTKGVFIPMENIPDEEKLMQDSEPLAIYDVQNQEGLGEVRQFLLQFNIRSTLIIPIVFQGEFLGSLGLDMIDRQRRFTQAEVDLGKLFANQVATAMANARNYQESQQRAKDLDALREVSLAMSSLENPEKVYKKLCQAAVELFPVQHSGLALFDRSLTYGCVVAEYPDQNMVGLKFPLRSNDSEQDLLDKRKPVFISNPSAAPKEVYEQYIAQDIHSAWYIPIISKDKIVGSLGLDIIGDGTKITKEQLELAKIFASHAAVTIENARLYEQEQQRTKQLQELRKVSLAITSQTDHDALLQEISKQAVHLFSARSSGIYTYDKLSNLLTLIANYPQDQNLVGKRLEIGEGMAGRLINDNKPYMTTEDYRNWLNRAAIYEENAPFEAVVEVPLKWNEEVIGVLYVEDRKGREFFENEINLLQSFANQAAIALKNAQLIRRISKAREWFGIVAEMAVLKDLQSTLDAVTRGTRDALDCDAVVLYTYDNELEQLGYPPTMIGVKEIKAKHKGTIVLDMLRRDEPYICPDTSLDPKFKDRRFTQDEGIASVVAFPLHVGDERVGVIFVNYRKQHQFTDDDIEEVKLFANQAAVAIHDAQVYEREQKRSASLKAIQMVSAEVSAELNVGKVLDLIAKKSAETFDVPATSVMLWDNESKNLIVKAGCGLSETYQAEQKITLRKVEEITAGIELGPRVFNIGSEALGYPNLVAQEGIVSVLVAPLTSDDGNLIGVLNIYSKSEERQFIKQDGDLAAIFANHASVAISNANLYERAAGRLSESKMLEAITSSLAGTLELDDLLNQVMNEARKLTDTESGSILFWDDQKQAFTEALSTTGANGQLELYSTTARPDGLAANIVRSRQPKVISDLTREKNANKVALKKKRLALVGVPLVCNGKCIGVLFVNRTKPYVFSDRQVSLLKSLADFAAVAIERARKYEELKKTKGLVGARTALAWMGMASSAWRHANQGKAITIKEEINNLRDDLPRRSKTKEVKRRLSKIERLATEIFSEPITAPLGNEEGVSEIHINELLRERLDQLRENEPDRLSGLITDFSIPETGTVRASAEWLQRVIDILIDNALNAIEEAPVQQITVKTRQVQNNYEIIISDTGPGFSEEALRKVFSEPLSKPKGSKGQGVGLLMAQTIVQAYGGELVVDSTNSSGTSMLVRLPLEE